MRVSIELEKYITDAESAQGMELSWTVLSIVQRQGGSSAQPSARMPALSNDHPYDPYIPTSSGPIISGKTAAIQSQIDDALGVMRDNINKVAERGERLDSLQDRTGNLAASAERFRRGANRVRKQQSWLSSIWEQVPSPSAAISSVQT